MNNLERHRVYDIIDTYFDHPTMTKVGNRDALSVYMAKCASHLVTSHRYIIAMVPTDVMMTGQVIPLRQLSWNNFQTRSLPFKEGEPNIFSYRPKRGGDYDSRISLQDRSDTYITYKSESLPLVLYTFPQEHHITFPQKATLNMALETYSTMIQFV